MADAEPTVGDPAQIGALRDMLRGRRAVCFDYYNTLVVDDWLPPPLWRRLRALGYDAASPALEAIFEPDAFDGAETPRLGGTPCHDTWMRGNWRRFLRLSGVAEAEADALLAQLLAEQGRFTTRPASGARMVLDAFRRLGWKIGLCSNWETPIAARLERDGLAPGLFDAVVISAQIGARKPHAKIFEALAFELGTAPEATLFVGDNWRTDITGALRAGFAPVWVRHGAPSKGLAPLVVEIDELDELHAALA